MSRGSAAEELARDTLTDHGTHANHTNVWPKVALRIAMAPHNNALKTDAALYRNRDRMAVESLRPKTQAIRMRDVPAIDSTAMHALGDIIRRALAFVSTTHKLDGEFKTRIGVDQSVIAETLMRWPSIDDRADDSPDTVAINNALNEVVSGLDLDADEWQQLGATRDQVKFAYAEWATQRGWKLTGLR